MDEATTDTAAVLRRVVRRTLTVLGGSVAGTAIAWAVSSACASAEAPPCELSEIAPVPGVEQLASTDAGQQLVEPLSDVVCAVGRIVPVPSVGDLGDGAARAADDFGQRLVDEFSWVPQVPISVDDLGRSDRPGATPAPGGGAHEPPSLVRPVGEQSAAAPDPVPGNGSFMDVLAGDSHSQALADGMTHRGSPEPVAPLTPFNPGKPVSLPAPASVPASGQPGHTGSGGADSPTAAAFSSCAGPLGLTHGRAQLAGDARVAGEPGNAPGVTPD